MQLSLAELEQVLRELSHERRTQLLRLAILNGFESLNDHQEQMELVRQSCKILVNPVSC
jgi:uncharacterized protein HemY